MERPRIQIPIPTLFGKAVTKASESLLPYLKTIDEGIQGINYIFGHPKEILNTLIDYEKTLEFQYKKYPLVALFMDFPELYAGTGYRCKVRLRVVIAHRTTEDIKAPRRYETSFEQVLYPVYEELMKQIPTVKGIMVTPGRIPHTKTDRPFWGRGGLYGSELEAPNDFLDCIEITDMELNIAYLNPVCLPITSNL